MNEAHNFLEIFDVTPEGFGKELIASFLLKGSIKTALIETGPGSSAFMLVKYLEKIGVEPDYIIVTHIHLDHGGGAGHLAEKYPNAKVIVHPRGFKHLLDPSKLWAASRQVLGEVAEIYGKPLPVPEEQLLAAEDGERIDLGDLELIIRHTPGHASHHMSIIVEPVKMLFAGDSAGVSFVVDGNRIRLPTTPPPFKPELYMESLEIMKSMNPQIIVLTHYGIDPLPAIEYLEKHRLELGRWLTAVKKIVDSGITDPQHVADELPNYLEEARKVVEYGGKIAYVTFYYSTVWGMVDYFMNEKKY